MAGPPTTDLQVNTTRLIPDGSDLGSPLIDSSANQGRGRDDNLFIRTAIQNKVKTADPFNISHLLSDQLWNGKNGETDNYCPEPVHPTSSSLPPPLDSNNTSTSTNPPPRDGNNNNNSNSTKPKKSILKKFSRGNKGVKSVLNNAFVSILVCVYLLGCLPHSSVSAYEEPNGYEAPTTYDVGQLCGLTHRRRLPPSQSAVLHIHTKVPSGIQRSILVLMVALVERNYELYLHQIGRLT